MEFKTQYAVDIDIPKIDFSKHMLIFGITDDYHSRAFRLIKPNSPPSIPYLDYRAYTVLYKIKGASLGNKISYLQIFKTNKFQVNSRIDVKNIVRGMESKKYE